MAEDKSGMTADEKNIIRNTWGLVKKDVPGNGTDLFIRLFEENPSYQQLFKSFKDVPVSELKANKKLLAHANNVMYAVTMLVDNIEDTEVLKELLTKLARNHRRRKITSEMFENLKISLMGTLKDKLGTELMNDEAVNAWDKTYGVIMSVIKPGLESTAEDD
jgi:hemoglobin-like flavoprotein